jgi:hypothetical protein
VSQRVCVEASSSPLQQNHNVKNIHISLIQKEREIVCF